MMCPHCKNTRIVSCDFKGNEDDKNRMHMSECIKCGYEDDTNVFIPKKISEEITTLKDREKKLVEVVNDLLTGIEHAIDLEYLGEGSTNQMNIDFVKKAREVLKELGVEI